MRNPRNKTTATAIAILLAVTIAASLALPIANAHTPPWTIPTWTYVAITNSVIGVNQPMTIVFWTAQYPPTANGAFGDRWSFTVDITKPDGTKETLGPITSDPVGAGWTAYTPTQVGTYTIVANVLEHKMTGLPAPPAGIGGYVGTAASYINDTYSASSSDPVTLIVQQEAVQPWPEAPLPTQFWTRPINEANRNWAFLAADWLAGAAHAVGPTSNFNYGTGPESAHIMWATPMWAGGIMNARFGETGYQTAHYEGLGFTPPIILNGKIYYNIQSLPRFGWRCLDLYTGKEVYFYNTTGPISTTSGSSSGSISQQSLAFGQIYNYESPNQHGGMPYLWSTSGPSSTWMMYDAYTGNYMCSIGNVSSSGTAVYGKDGSILRYNVVNYGTTAAPNYYLTVWNTSRAIWWKSSWGTTFADYWLWRPGLNVTYDGRNGFSLNASIPNVAGATIRAVREDRYMILGTSGKNNGTYVLQGWLAALNLKPDSNGIITPTLLWNITFTPPQQSYPDLAITGIFAGGSVTMGTVDPEDGVFLFSESLTRRRWGYSLATGQQLWGPSAPEPQMNFYGMSSNIYNGMLLASGYSGVLIAYDIKTGKVLWNYTASQVGFESPYGNYPIGITFIADGKIYLTSSEHSPTQPLWRGSYLRCVNASNGVELWKCLFWGMGMGGGSGAVIADGFIVGLNAYDNQIYCFGKGPSATEVMVQNDVITRGNSVLIKGEVTDQSPGSKSTPAISDESMEAWMEYLYAEQAIPGNATGVEVTLDTLDPNGNFVHIGTVTSDMSGMFKKTFTPEVPGEYAIIATFAGSKSYYSSYAETAISVSEAPPPTAPPEYPQPIDYTMHFVYATIVMVIAIAIAVVLILWKK